MLVWRSSFIVACFFLFISMPVIAEDIRSDRQLAQKYFLLGKELYDRSDYEGALAQFKQSYKYSKMPELRYNMARCYEFMGKLNQAIEHYQAFLATKPANAAVVKSRINNLKRRLAKQSSSEPIPPTTSEPATAPTTSEPTPTPTTSEPTPAPSSSEPALTGKKRKPTKRPLSPPPPSKIKRIIGWSLIGAGGAALITGTILGAMAKGKASDLEQAAERHEEWSDVKDDEDSGKNLELGAIVSLAIGGAAAVTGAVLLFLDYRSAGNERRAWISPTISNQGAMVIGHWRF